MPEWLNDLRKKVADDKGFPQARKGERLATPAQVIPADTRQYLSSPDGVRDLNFQRKLVGEGQEGSITWASPSVLADQARIRERIHARSRGTMAGQFVADRINEVNPPSSASPPSLGSISKDLQKRDPRPRLTRRPGTPTVMGDAAGAAASQAQSGKQVAVPYVGKSPSDVQKTAKFSARLQGIYAARDVTEAVEDVRSSGRSAGRRAGSTISYAESRRSREGASAPRASVPQSATEKPGPSKGAPAHEKVAAINEYMTRELLRLFTQG